MTRPETLRNHGDEVVVFDAKGNYQLRGVVIGVHRAEHPFYDILPRGEKSLTKAVRSVPASRLRGANKPIISDAREPAADF